MQSSRIFQVILFCILHLWGVLFKCLDLFPGFGTSSLAFMLMLMSLCRVECCKWVPEVGDLQAAHPTCNGHALSHGLKGMPRVCVLVEVRVAVCACSVAYSTFVSRPEAGPRTHHAYHNMIAPAPSPPRLFITKSPCSQLHQHLFFFISVQRHGDPYDCMKR